MKKFTQIAVGAGLVFGTAFLFVNTPRSEIPAGKIQRDVRVPLALPSADEPLPQSAGVRRTIIPISNPTPSIEPEPISEPFLRTVTHTKNDFAWGQFSNTVVEESLHLSSKAFRANAAGSGTFVSGTDLGHRSFNVFSVNYSAVVPSGAALKLLLRTTTANEQWSDWQVIGSDQLDRPIRLENPADGWQYQLAFSAPSPVSSPQINSVTIITQKVETQEPTESDIAESEPAQAR